MYIRYIHKLCDMHLQAENFTGTLNKTHVHMLWLVKGWALPNSLWVFQQRLHSLCCCTGSCCTGMSGHSKSFFIILLRPSGTARRGSAARSSTTSTRGRWGVKQSEHTKVRGHPLPQSGKPDPKLRTYVRVTDTCQIFQIKDKYLIWKITYSVIHKLFLRVLNFNPVICTDTKC